MAYFLKKTVLKGRTYLSIVESFYDAKKKDTAHRVFQSLRSVEYWKDHGIEDPVSHFQKEVDALNRERAQKDVVLIGETPERKLGYFPVKRIMEKLQIQKYVDLFRYNTNFTFDLYDVYSKLTYARIVEPCSKYRTFHEVLPCLYERGQFSYDQLLEALCFLGNEYTKFVELLTHQVKKHYGINTQRTYFDCTNFYFEIDREDDFRRKGPSKEQRRDPIVGLGLLLDADQIPVGMTMYPGNESEKPKLKEVIATLKESGQITGRTIRVADKGLNCAQNILDAKKGSDGYLFSRSVKTLSETEKAWVLLDQDYVTVHDAQGKERYRYKECVDEFPYESIDENGKKHTVKLTEKRIVTYNPSLAAKQRQEIHRMVEKARCLCVSRAKRNEFGESAKYTSFRSTRQGEETDDAVSVRINEKKVAQDLDLAGYNLLVTSETQMTALEMYETYHHLWRIEESFRIMKSDLDARPVYVQKREAIQGHFLICYTAVLLVRLLQFKELGNRYSASELFAFFHQFRVVKADRNYINISVSTPFLKQFSEQTGLPLMHYMLSDSQIKKLLDHPF